LETPMDQQQPIVAKAEMFIRKSVKERWRGRTA
jgi:hypothetical protein